jgi:hypothetical protein
VNEFVHGDENKLCEQLCEDNARSQALVSFAALFQILYFQCKKITVS